MKKTIKKLYRRYLIFMGFICECGSKELEEYGYNGYLRCRDCKRNK